MGGRMSEDRLTIDDVRHRAEEVQALARAEVRRVTHADPVKLVAAGIIGMALLASLAYYLGTRKCWCGDGSE